MELYFLKGEQAMLKRHKEKNKLNENIFIKIVHLNKNIKVILEEVFKDFNGLTHYEIIRFHLQLQQHTQKLAPQQKAEATFSQSSLAL